MQLAEGSIVSASHYRLVAVSFWESAKILYENRTYTDGCQTSMINMPPFYYLVSHASELFLKSALLKRGVTESDLRKQNVRHNLVKLATILAEKGLHLSENTIELIKVLHPIHEKHYLRYLFLKPNHEIFRISTADINAALEELLMATKLPSP